MTKTLKLLGPLREITGSKEITVPFEDGQTVRKLLEDISTLEPTLHEEIMTAEGAATGLVQILVHGRNIEFRQGIDTPIKDSDIVTLLPPSAGG